MLFSPHFANWCHPHVYKKQLLLLQPEVFMEKTLFKFLLRYFIKETIHNVQIFKGLRYFLNLFNKCFFKYL